jgi:YD repeat-containing protein
LGGTTDFTWDALGRLTTLTQATELEKRVDFQWNVPGQIEQVTRFTDLAGTSPAVVSTYDFDCGGCPTRMSGVNHRRASDDGLISSRLMTRDGAGHITQMSDAQGARNFVWDGAHRLIGVNGATTENYVYDGVGNRLSSHRSATTVYSYQVGLGCDG